MSIESVMPTNHLILCRPLLLLPSIFPSIRIFSSESVLRIRWPKYWSFSFNISPSNEYPELISFRMGWLDLLAVQVTLKSLLQHHSSKASILWCSAFFMAQLSYIHSFSDYYVTIFFFRLLYCISDLYIYIYSFSDYFHYRLLQDIEYSSLCYRIELYSLSILYITICIC